MNRLQNKKVTVIFACLFFLLLLSNTILAARPNSGEKNIMGRVSECQSGYIKIDNILFYITPSTTAFSNTRDKINLSEIYRRGLVQISFSIYGKRLIADKIKLIDTASSGKQQSFQGEVQAAYGNRFLLEGKTFHIDEFTIRTGVTVQKRIPKNWLGINIIVVAVEKAPDIWVAEFIREDFDTTAMVE